MIIRKDTTKTKIGEYLHKYAFSLAVSTFLRTIWQGFFIIWPGISEINFIIVLKNMVPTAKGHLEQEREYLQSTKSNTEDDFFLSHKPKKTYEYVSIFIPSTEPKEVISQDLTGRFPYMSSRRN